MTDRSRRSQIKSSEYNYPEEDEVSENSKFILGDEVFATLGERVKCGIIAEVQNEQPPRYLVNKYPYPGTDRRYYDENQLKKVTNSKEQLIWARNLSIDMEVVTFSTLRYGIEAINSWEVRNPNKYQLLLEMSGNKKPSKSNEEMPKAN